MELMYLGTSAAEGFPAVFCNCEYCQEARRLKGKNIRTRSQTLINNDLLIDLPADTYYHFLNNGIEGDKIKYLLITHTHSDHFYPEELLMHGGAFAHNLRAPEIKVCCGRDAYELIKNRIESHELPGNIEPILIKPYETVILGEYSVTALPARHNPENEALFYIIRRDKTILYAHDTGYFFDDVFAYFKKEEIKFDMISLDCTNVDINASDEARHMGFSNIGRLIQRLSDIGSVDDNTIKFVNHFSHNANPIHHILEKRALEYGCDVAYDGCKVRL